MRIEPPCSRCLIGRDSRRPKIRAGCAWVNARSKETSALPSGALDERSILIAEDDEAIAVGLVRVLESQLYSVRRLAQGAGALRAAEAPVGLVILDLGLPDVDGLEVCRRLRASRPDLAILILTARDHELDIVAGTGCRRR